MTPTRRPFKGVSWFGHKRVYKSGCSGPKVVKHGGSNAHTWLQGVVTPSRKAFDGGRWVSTFEVQPTL